MQVACVSHHPPAASAKGAASRGVLGARSSTYRSGMPASRAPAGAPTCRPFGALATACGEKRRLRSRSCRASPACSSPIFPSRRSCRADPDLAGRPLALTEGRGPHARVVAASATARARGRPHPAPHARPGAHASPPALVVRPRDPAAERSAALALADVAASLASRVEMTADGAVFLDAGGAQHLVASERGLATALVARAERVGLAARAGVGGEHDRRAARGARMRPTVSRWCRRRRARLPRSPAARRASRPTPRSSPRSSAGASAASATSRASRVAEVATRLGPAGAALVRAARGEDERPLAPQPPGGPIEEAMGLEYASTTLEPLLFVLRGLLERAVARVGLEGVGCARARPRARPRRPQPRQSATLALAAPTRDVKTMLTCLRVELEARPPRAAISAIVLTAVPERGPRARSSASSRRPARRRSGSRPRSPASPRSAARIVSARRRSSTSHRPGAAASTPFTPAGERQPAGAAPTDGPAGRARLPPAARRSRCSATAGARTSCAATASADAWSRAAGPWRVAARVVARRAVSRATTTTSSCRDGGVYRCYRDALGAVVRRWRLRLTTSSCAAGARSASSPAPRCPRTWSRAPRRSGTTRSRSPTATASTARRASSSAARKAGVRPLVGAEVPLAGAGLLWLLVESRAGLPATSAGSSPPARSGGEKGAAAGRLGAGRGARGRAPLPRRRRRGPARARRRRRCGSTACAGSSASASPSTSSATASATGERLARRLADLAAAHRVPVVATNDVRHATPDGRALLDVLTCIRLGTTLDQAGRRLLRERRAPPEAPGRDGGAASATCPTRSAQSRRIAERCAFTLADLGYRFPDFPLPPGETPIGYPPHAHAATARASATGRSRRACAASSSTSSALIAQARPRRLLPDRLGHRPLLPRARHPLPGPRLGGQQRGLLRARHHRRRRRRHGAALRALPLRGARRVARHRPRPAERRPRERGDPVRLPALRRARRRR